MVPLLSSSLDNNFSTEIINNFLLLSENLKAFIKEISVICASCNICLVNLSSSEVQPLCSAVPVSFVAHGGGIAKIWGEEILQTLHFTCHSGLIYKCENVIAIFPPIKCRW